MGLEEVIRRKHSGDNEHMEFIFSEEKKIIVTAPAGCGKTTAMISKIAWELGKGTISLNFSTITNNMKLILKIS